MDAVSGFYETADINSLISDFLAFPKFDRSLVLIRDGRGISTHRGVIDQPLSILIYIKPGKASSVNDSIMFITSLFNEHTPIAIGDKTITLRQMMEHYVAQ